MTDKKEISGRWWIGGKSSPPLGGILSQEDGLELKIVIPADTSAAEAYGSLREQGLPKVPHVIRGKDAQNQPVILYGCMCHSRTRSAGEVTLEISALAGVQGLDIATWQTPAVRTVIIHIHQLNRWLQTDGLASRQFPDGKTGWVSKDYSEQIYQVADGIACRIVESSTESHGQDRDLFTPDCKVCLSFASPRSLEEVCEKWVNWVAHLISLLAGTNMPAEEIEVSDLDLFSMDDSMKSALAFSTNVATVLGRAQTLSRMRRANLKPMDMPAPYSSVRGQFATVLQQWHRLNEDLEPVVTLFTTVVFHHSIYSTAEFLFLVQALEVYHVMSGHFESRQIPQAEQRERIRIILALVPAEYKEWVKKKLSPNYKYLNERLLELFQANQGTAAIAFGDLQRTAEKIGYTRNHYTHYTSDTENDKFMDQNEIAQLNFSLEHFLWALLLKEVGAPSSAIDKIMSSVRTACFTNLRSPDEPEDEPKKGCLAMVTGLASLVLIAGYLLF